MRNIKFRIWDKVNKLFIYMDHVNIKAYNLNKYTDGKIRLGLEMEYTNHDCPVVETIPRHQNDYVIQMCTGIKDKNGKEIYEGDLINYPAYNREEIVFKNGRFCFENGFLLPVNDESRMNIEIAGNIFEGEHEYNDS